MHALSADKKNQHTWFLAAIYFDEIGEVAEAIRIYYELIRNDPDNHQYKYHLGLDLFLLGEYSDALNLFVYRTNNFNVASSPNQLHRATSGSGLTIHLTEEQGLGDQIMFLQLLHFLKPKDNLIIVEIDVRLIPIYENEFPTVKFIKRDPNGLRLGNSIISPIGDLLLAFFIPYISSDKFTTIGSNLPSRWEKQIAGNKKTIGISWATIAKHGGLKRSISIDLILEQLDTNEHHLLVLQYLAQKEDLEKISEAGFTFEEVEEGYSDIFAVAKAIKRCDLVVTIDNYILHLSGALGTKTFAMLPLSCSYRWGLKKETSFFYEDVTLLRQLRLTDWQAPLSDLKIKVRELYFDN